MAPTLNLASALQDFELKAHVANMGGSIVCRRQDAGKMAQADQTAPAKLDATVKAIFGAFHVLFDADTWPWDQGCSATDCRGGEVEA
jgi:hypothetical protein